MLRSAIAVTSAVMMLTANAWGRADDGPVMPMPNGGEEIVFDVYRNGDTPFGTHALSFRQEGQDLLVGSTRPILGF